MISIISPERALRASGRFIVTIRTWPRFSTRQWGDFAETSVFTAVSVDTGDS